MLQRKLDEMDFSMKQMQRSLLREIEEERSSWSKERQQLKMTISKAESMQAELQVRCLSVCQVCVLVHISCVLSSTFSDVKHK